MSSHQVLMAPRYLETFGGGMDFFRPKIDIFYCDLEVSWIRHADTHLLTTGMYRYTPDLRFSALHKPSSENWVLELRNTSREDQGPTLILFIEK